MLTLGWSADGQSLFVTNFAPDASSLLNFTLDGKYRLLYKASKEVESPRRLRIIVPSRLVRLSPPVMSGSLKGFTSKAPFDSPTSNGFAREREGHWHYRGKELTLTYAHLVRETCPAMLMITVTIPGVPVGVLHDGGHRDGSGV